jgi:uncharacterized NAD(P)/FAD-binding protein YdhS
MHTIAIIGGGLSGTLLAIQLLLQQGEGPLKIYLVERAPCLGKGVAYSTCVQSHLLNVPAGKMSLFPDDSDHFVRWLQTTHLPFGAPDFAPRPVYARYIADTFAAAQTQYPGRLQGVHGEAVDVREAEGGLVVELVGGQTLPCTQAVLALGNFPPTALSVLENALASDPRYVRDPWCGDPFAGLNKYNAVLLVGTGLTMVDMVRSLRDRSHQGEVVAVSTHGELPSEHCAHDDAYAPFGEAVPASSAEALRIVKAHLRQAATTGTGWHAVIDALRPHTAAWWSALPVAEQHRFLRHLGHRWNVARHRMPPESGQAIREMMAHGQLRLLHGRVTAAESSPQGVTCTVGAPGRLEQQQVTAGRVINCTGPESNPLRWGAPLVQQLLRRGTVRLHANGLGLDATAEGALVNAAGVPSDRLLAIGPMLKAALFESVAVPEIRSQAQQLAHALLAAPNLNAAPYGVRNDNRT